MSSHLLVSEAALSLGDFTRRSLIVPSLRARDALGVIRELSEVLQREACIPDLLPFFHAAINREFFFGTGIKHGFAFPHARVTGLQHLSFALGRSAEPLAWVSAQKPLVRLVFLCAVPATNPTNYFLLTSGLTRLALDTQMFESLLASDGSDRMMDLLKRIPLRPPLAAGL